MSTFVARYEGPCAAGCGVRVRPGDDVVYVDDEVVHADCEELALLPPYRRGPARTDRLEELFARPLGVVCGTCFVEKPCRCDDEEK